MGTECNNHIVDRHIGNC